MPAASVLASAALDPFTLHDLATAADTKAAHESLQRRIGDVAPELLHVVTGLQLVELTDQAWLLLRPTVAAARVASGQDI